MNIQWHPLFAELLRPLLEDYYDVQTNVPVGDAPRQADVVLLQRTASRPLPFTGVWRHLTIWNVLEYKGPTVSARLEHLDLLVELGLGIHRRLNEQRKKNKQKAMQDAEVSFWYLVNDIGRRFLKRAISRLGRLEPQAEGIWRGQILGRPVLLISGVDLPVAAESVPFHLLGIEPTEKKSATARLIGEQPPLQKLYAEFLGGLHPEIIKELLKAMARTSKKGPQFHLMPLVEVIGMQEAINQLGAKKILDEMGMDRIIDEVGTKSLVDNLLHRLPEKERAELRRRLIDEVGTRSLVDNLLHRLSEKERAELRQRLAQEESRKK